MLKISDDRIRFTDAYVRKLALPAGKADHIAWDPDLPGFGVRLRSGKASYVVQYRVGIEQRRKSLGDVRKVSVDDARGIARKRFAQVELGVDPDAEEENRRAEQAADGRTFEKIVELYLEAQKPRVRPNTYIAEERYLRRHCEPLRKKPVSKVTFEDIAGLIRKLVQAHGATSAARARGALSSFFAWCMRQGLGVKVNPTIGTDNPVYGKAPRDRVLTDEEMRQRIRDVAASRDLSEEQIKPALTLKHHEIARFTEKHGVSLEWLLEGMGRMFTMDPMGHTPKKSVAQLAALVRTLPEAEQRKIEAVIDLFLEERRR